MYADISAVHYRPWRYWQAMATAIEYGVTHKLLLGSDFPSATVDNVIDGLRRVNDVVEGTRLPQVPESVMESIIHATGKERCPSSAEIQPNETELTRMTPRSINATVTSVETAPVSLAVRRELVVSGARGTHDQSDFLLVRVTTSAGVQGYGEVSATLLWSGEDSGTADHVIRTALAPAIIGRPLSPVADLQARMDRVVAGSQFTKAGVSTALWDAFARTLDVPLAVALGGPLRTSIPVKFSLSGDGDRLRRTYETAHGLGYRSFKVKVGLDPVSDAARFADARGAGRARARSSARTPTVATAGPTRGGRSP